MRTWILRAGREWPLWIAIAGILSLLLLPRAAGLGSAPDPVDPALPEPQKILNRARAGDFPGAAALQRAWTESPESRRELAALMSEFGLHQDAVARLRELHDQTRDAALALDLVPALLRLAAAEPSLRHALLDEASARMSDYFRVAPPERRLAGILVQARIYREARRDEELLALLATELAEAKTPADRGLLHLERGRAFDRLGRNMEAMSSSDEAEKLLGAGWATIHIAELYARAGNAECLEVCARISAAWPQALLVAGAFQLKTRPEVALDALQSGFARIRRPSAIDEASFNFPWVHASLLAAADREIGAARLGRIASVFAEISRLMPASSRVGRDHAAILLRAKRYEEAADRFLAAGAPQDAAEACAEGGLHLRAASLFTDPYRRAVSLKKAGDVAGAIAAFEEVLAKSGASGAFSGLALVEKAALQEPEDALATLDRVLKAREVATDPTRDDWARALLGRGRTLLRLSRPAEARKPLQEYLERYPGTPATVEAAWLLVGAAIGEREWARGLERLRDLEERAARIAELDRAPYAGLLQEARFTEGDLHFNLGDYAAAHRAYGEAVRRYPESEDRLWGLIGRARALARLERKEEARRDYTNARAIFDGLAGQGREYWEIALDALAKEVR